MRPLVWDDNFHATRGFCRPGRKAGVSFVAGHYTRIEYYNYNYTCVLYNIVIFYYIDILYIIINNNNNLT